jgi:uncharacterized membrane protein YhhN
LPDGTLGVEMNAFRTLLPLSIAFSLIFLLFGPDVSDRWPFFKVGSILLLAILGFRVNVMLGTALSLGAVGDFLLGMRRLGGLDAETLFLSGLASFLLSHLVYIAMFRRYRATSGWKTGWVRWFGVLVVVIALGAVLGALRSSLGALLLPVVIYALVLAGMAISAQLTELGNSLAAFGALCFVASDAMLAMGKFRGPFPGHEPLVWVTYYIAQLLIFLGVARGHSPLSVRQ